MGAYMKQVYPTFIVNIEDNPVHPFLVCVPDLDILTEGDSLFNAIEMARDAIGVAGITLEDRSTEIPTPSEQDVAIEKVMKYSDEVDFSKGILTYVDIDFIEYRRKIDLENPVKAEKLKERLESFYGRPIDEIHMESDGTNSYDKKQKAYRELVKIVNSRTTKSTITDDKAEWLSYLDERYGEELTSGRDEKSGEELTLDDIFKDYDGEIPRSDEVDWGKPVGAEFGAVNLIEEESVNNQKNDDGAKELYNLIIKMEREEVSAEKIIETIKLMGEK
jgi:predicted RNase H-like HicB family nuclease